MGSICQDAEQDMFSFHGLMTVGDDGRYAFTTVKPVEYTVPSDGPVGEILRHVAVIHGDLRTYIIL